MSLSPNEMTPYIKKIQQKFDEAQTFLVKNGFLQATKGLLQDIENANGINKNTNQYPSHEMKSKITKSLRRQENGSHVYPLKLIYLDYDN